MTSVLTALLGAAAKGGLLAALVRALEVGKRPSARHGLWAIVLVGHVLVLAAVPLSPVWRVAVPLVPESAVELLGSPGAQPPETSAHGAAATQDRPPEGAGPTAQGAIGSAAGSSELPRGSLPWPTLGVLVWAVGCLVLLLRAAIHVGGARRWVGGATASREPAWRRQVEYARRVLGLTRRVEVRYLDGLRTPMITGGLRPVLLLPPSARAWEARRRRAVALHELAHVARLDGLSRGLAHLVRALFWFDPLVWYAVRRLESEAESACDELVVRWGPTRERYVQELVGIVREARGRTPPGLAVSLGRLRGLEGRTRRLMRGAGGERGSAGERRARGRAPVALSATGGVLVALSLGGLRADGPRPTSHAVVPAPRGEPPSGCVYRDGLHRNVHRPTKTGTVSWRVGWDGAGCRVRFEARGTYADVEGRGLVPTTGSVHVSVTGSRPGRDLELFRERAGGRLVVRSAGRRLTGARRREILAWNDAFAREIARHTAYDARRRVAELLSEGGTEAVFAEVARTAGDHAGGVYLRELARNRDLATEEVGRVLTLAHLRVENEAVLSALLGDVAERHPVAGEALREAYLTAVGDLDTRAARAAALRGLDATRTGPS